MDEATEVPGKRIARFCATSPSARGVVMWDEPTTTLLDVYSGKALVVDLAQVEAVVEKQAADTREPYLLVMRSDGLQYALAPMGIAFAPDPSNILEMGPPLPLPPVVCWRDHAGVSGRVRHVLDAHPDEPPGREVLDMLRYCIALVDGARAIGFDVDREERDLAADLERIERRVAGR